ncbi:MAG: glycosyltransferase family 4 protein [Ruminococcaceae bacterium]|nr:glycosyltransferase family 4 protein [Oscillospiraceae bacterium]
MTRLLILCRYFPPENKIGSVRPSKIAKYLAKSNEYKITVITAVPYGVDAPLYEVTQDGIEVYRVDSGKIASLLHFKKSGQGAAVASSIGNSQKVSLKHKLIGKVFAMRMELEKKSQLQNAKKLLRRMHGNFDVMFSTYNTEFGHLLGLWYKKHNKDIKWIADFRDSVWLTNSDEKRIQYAKKFASDVAQNCDYITAVTEGILKTHESDFGTRAREVLYNGYDADDIIACEPINDGILRMVYTGELYSGQRDLSPLFKALDHLSKEGKIDLSKVVITYAGNSGGIFEHQIKPYKDIRYENKGFIPRAEAMRIQQESSILLLSSWCYKNDKYTLTGKFFEYLGVARPILCTVAGEESGSILKSIINENALGFCYENAMDADDFKGLCAFLEQQYNAFVETGKCIYIPDKELVKQFEYKNIAERTNEIINSLLK